MDRIQRWTDDLQDKEEQIVERVSAEAEALENQIATEFSGNTSCSRHPLVDQSSRDLKHQSEKEANVDQTIL